MPDTKPEGSGPSSPKPGTPLPWMLEADDGASTMMIQRAGLPEGHYVGVCGMDLSEEDDDGKMYADSKKDLEYIVHAANSLPELEEENKRLREALEYVAGHAQIAMEANEYGKQTSLAEFYVRSNAALYPNGKDARQ